MKKLIHNALNKNKIVIVTGFHVINNNNQITTLKRWFDTSAVVAAAINASECQIFTDVDGVCTTDQDYTIKLNVYLKSHLRKC